MFEIGGGGGLRIPPGMQEQAPQTVLEPAYPSPPHSHTFSQLRKSEIFVSTPIRVNLAYLLALDWTT